MTESAEIGIIGGTGIYDPGLLNDCREINVDTPYGKPSESITLAEYSGRRVAFIPRHGKKHAILPHMINYRANIWALKELGVQRIVSPSAVGSLKEDLVPGSFVLPSQFVDFTKSRINSFSKKGDVFHISSADPFCQQMQDVVLNASKKTGMKMHTDKTYVCIEGPRFSTRAESNFFRTSVNADIIGMTLVPECQLAREAQICYTSIATVTDYDVWAQKPVTTKEIIETLHKNSESIKKLLVELIGIVPKTRTCKCSTALDEARF
ncbi:MAG: methylthioadenosine phosphorylase [Cenarchaeum symbiont of Oopsacas minuta]|nr:methylthioadenosine phosphorylase [Cenarchaeum symbiont of Oopsacas minuta]